jgi:hypothetical protein
VRRLQAVSRAPPPFPLSDSLLGFYLVCLAALIALTALFRSALVEKWLLLAYAYAGRALLLLFTGSLSLQSGDVVSLVAGCLAMTLGAVYGLLQFISAVGGTATTRVAC